MPDITVIIRVHLRDDCYSSQFGFPRTSRNGWTDRTRDVTAGMEYFVLRAHAHARAHAHTSTPRVYTSASHDVSRRSSRQILFRKIGLPLSSTTERQQLCVGGSSRRTNTCNARGCGRVWKTFEAITPPNLSFSSNIQSLAFLFCAPDRDTSRIFFFSGISQPCGMMSPVMVNAGKPLAPEIRVIPTTRDNIADRSLRVVQRLRAQTFAEGITKMSSDIIIYHNYLFSYKFCWRKFFHSNWLSSKCRKKYFSHQFLRA